MSANTINATYTIEWCRNWVPVTKVFFVNWMWTECYRYSDWLMSDPTTPDDTGWIEGDCAHFDAETTCVAENGNLYYIRFDTVTNTYRVYDFNGVDVTWTVTPIKCDEWLPAASVSEWSYVALSNVAVLTVVTMPVWFNVSEIEIFALNPTQTYEVIMTTSGGGNITHLVNANAISRYSIELPSNAGYITSLSINPSASIPTITVNFYWYL